MPPPPERYDSATDTHWMHQALDQARQGVGHTSPNPPVGAVIVAQGKIIGQGYHRKAGGPHAEVEAIRDAQKFNAKLLPGATIYVTLEPCSTHGRTPPCTEAVKAAGIKRVVYGASDPNPAHAGRCDEILYRSRIEVTSGVLEDECRKLIRPFAKFITTGMPYVIAKSGQSLDGRITRPAGEGQWLTNEAARAHGRRLRLRVDAIIVGAETVRKDNPRLTLRDGNSSAKAQPWRVVLTRSGDIPPQCHLLTDEFKDRTLIMHGKDLPEVLAELGKNQVMSVLIEGGGNILGQAFRERLVDEVYWYVAPLFCGGSGSLSISGPALPHSVELTDVVVRPMGDNVLVHGVPVWPAQ